MVQTTDPENWRAPWNPSPQAGTDAATEEPQPPRPAAPSGAPSGYPTQPIQTQTPSHPTESPYYSPYPQAFYGTATPDPTTQPTDVTPQPPSDGGKGGWRGLGSAGRPGWLGVSAVGVGAAVLASLLTAGVINHQNQGAPSSLTSSTNPSASAQAGPAPVTGSSPLAPNWVAVADAVEPSVVSVQVSAGQASGEGSGVIIDTSGRVLTNNHVVADAGQGGSIVIVLSDGRGFPAKVVGTDPQSDLAVIQMQNAPSGLKPATLGDSNAVKVGDPVMAVGNPLGLSETATTGIISALNRPVTTSQAGGGGGENPNPNNPFGGQSSASEPVVTNAIQTDAAINPGNSGGALVDWQGRVIGINSSIASLGSSAGGQSGSIGLGFAIPINQAKQVARQLIDNGTVAHAWLGVNLSENTVTLDGAQRDAAIIEQVTSGTPAEKAGLRNGDAVIAVDGEPVNGADSLVAQIRERAPGTTVNLTVVRDGKTQNISVVLGTRPN